MDPSRSGSSLLTYPQLQNLLRIEFARARRYDYALSCIVLAVDRLEHLSDLYGAELKCEILDRVVRVVRSHARSSDAVGMSSDRIIAVLPHTDGEGSQILADRLHAKLQELSFQVGGRALEVTGSVGLATCSDRNHIFFDSLLKNAEQALEEALSSGGNAVQVHRHTPTPTAPAAGDRHSA